MKRELSLLISFFFHCSKAQLREIAPSDQLKDLADRFEQKAFKESNNDQKLYLRIISERLLDLKRRYNNSVQTSITIPQQQQQQQQQRTPITNPIVKQPTVSMGSLNPQSNLDEESKYWQKV